MLQEVIVLLIVLYAILYTLFNLMKLVLPQKKQNSVCGSCSGCSLKKGTVSNKFPIKGLTVDN